MRDGRAKEVLDELLKAAGLTMQDVTVEMVYQRNASGVSLRRMEQRMSDEPAEEEPVTEPQPGEPPVTPDEPAHVARADCWCGPDEDEPGVFVHRIHRFMPSAH